MEALRERHDPELKADRSDEHPRVREHVLGAAAADVEGHHDPRVERQAATESAQGEPRLLVAGDDLDALAGVGGQPGRERGAVARVAHGARRDDAHRAGARFARAGHVRRDGGGRAHHRRVSQGTGRAKAFPEPRHPLLGVDRRPRAVRAHIGDEQSHCVGAEVDDSETHRQHTSAPPVSPAGRCEQSVRGATTSCRATSRTR